MNRSELTRATRRHLAEGGSGLHSDADIQAQLNRSAQSIAAERGLLKKRLSVSAVDGAVTLPAEVVGVTRVYAGPPSRELFAVAPGAAPLPGESAGGQAETFSYDPAWGPGLNVYPPRSVALTVEVRSAGAPMTADASVPWDGAYEPYHDVIALHAAHMLAAQAGPSGARESVYLQRFNSRMDDFKAAVAMQKLGTPAMRIAGVLPRPRRTYR